MITSRHPYPPSPERQALNDAQRAVLARVEELTTSALHSQRARVQLAGMVPPPGVPTDQQVVDVVAATVPEIDWSGLVTMARAERRRNRMELVRW